MHNIQGNFGLLETVSLRPGQQNGDYDGKSIIVAEHGIGKVDRWIPRDGDGSINGKTLTKSAQTGSAHAFVCVLEISLV